PAGATPDMFMGPDGKPLPFREAVISGQATGAPGAIAMLALAQAEHGKKPWKDLFREAERLAGDGFVVSRRLAAAASSDAPQAAQPDALAYFTKPGGGKIQVGDVLRNPAYAATVRKIAAEGPRGLLEGALAEAIVARVAQGPRP